MRPCKPTCPDPQPLDRRSFLKKSISASMAGAVVGLSFEEEQLMAQAAGARPAPISGDLPAGKIGDVTISRLICGGNLISGFAHSRDLIYVSSLLKNYFTDEKVMETWEICEEHGINTMIVNPNDQHAVDLFKRYRRERGGEMQWLAQAGPKSGDFSTVVKRAVDDGAVGVFLLGNIGDRWTFDGKVDRIGNFVEAIKAEGVIAGVAGHSLEMLEAVEGAGVRNDFFMKTLHHTKYWSSRRPDQEKPVIENWSVDNYYDMEPEKTVAFMGKVTKPWIAYKVLAAGAISPSDGFNFAFRNGADFVCVGMFDFQVAEDVVVVREALAKHQTRPRSWMA